MIDGIKSPAAEAALGAVSPRLSIIERHKYRHIVRFCILIGEPY